MPGSFTGVRTRRSQTGNGDLAVRLLSLATLARGALCPLDVHVAVAIDARMNEVYFGGYAMRGGDASCATRSRMHAGRRDIVRRWTRVASRWKWLARFAESFACVAARAAAVASDSQPRALDALALGLHAWHCGESVPPEQVLPTHRATK